MAQSQVAVNSQPERAEVTACPSPGNPPQMMIQSGLMHTAGHSESSSVLWNW